MTQQAARVDFRIADNETWVDALQFGTAGDTTWSFTGQSFRLDIKGNPEDTSALLSLTSGSGQIVVDDVVLRVLHMLVPEATITGALIPGEYVYDFIMFDASTPAVRARLMYGKLCVEHGITGG